MCENIISREYIDHDNFLYRNKSIVNAKINKSSEKLA